MVTICVSGAGQYLGSNHRIKCCDYTVSFGYKQVAGSMPVSYASHTTWAEFKALLHLWDLIVLRLIAGLILYQDMYHRSCLCH